LAILLIGTLKRRSLLLLLRKLFELLCLHLRGRTDFLSGEDLPEVVDGELLVVVALLRGRDLLAHELFEADGLRAALVGSSHFGVTLRLLPVDNLDVGTRTRLLLLLLLVASQVDLADLQGVASVHMSAAIHRAGFEHRGLLLGGVRERLLLAAELGGQLYAILRTFHCVPCVLSIRREGEVGG